MKVINKIYLTNKNTPNTHIDCVGSKYLGKDGDEYSFFPAENEVLIFPFLTFQVLGFKQTHKKHFDDVEITIVELPFQNTLSIETKIEQTRLIWVGADADQFLGF